MLREAVDGVVFLLKSPFGPEDVWDEFARTLQAEIIRKRIRSTMYQMPTLSPRLWGRPGRIIFS